MPRRSRISARILLPVLLALSAPRDTRAWSGLEAAVALFPETREAMAGRPSFEYADLARLRREGALDSVLAVGLVGAAETLLSREGMERALGVPPDRLLRAFQAGGASRPLLVFWGDGRLAADAARRLRARGFAAGALGDALTLARWPDDHADLASEDRSDPFSFGGRPQRVLAAGSLLGGALRLDDLRALDAQRRATVAARPPMARAFGSAARVLRAGLPGVAVVQAFAMPPDLFLTSETERQRWGGERRPVSLPPGAAPDDPRLPVFGFALFGAGTLRDSPVLFLAAVYGDRRLAAFAAPIIAGAVRNLPAGDGPAPLRVQPHVLHGEGLAIAAVTVSFAPQPRTRAAEALRRWRSLIEQLEFTPLDLSY